MKFKGGRLARKSLSSQKRVQPQLYHPTMVNFCLEELHLRRILFFFFCPKAKLLPSFMEMLPQMLLELAYNPVYLVSLEI